MLFYYISKIKNTLDNFIAIDISLNSTGISIWNKNGYKFIACIKSSKPTKWTKTLDDYAEIKYLNYTHKDNYSDQQYANLCDYESNVEIITNEISKYIIPGSTIIAFEGYAYNAMGNSLIDIVGFSTLLKSAMKNKFNAKFEIYSPGSIKKNCCGLVYGWEEKGKKTKTYSTRSIEGIAGGTFKKHQMLKALNDYPCNSQLSVVVKELFDDLYHMKSIPTPFSDLIDSYWILKILMNDMVFKVFKINNQ